MGAVPVVEAGELGHDRTQVRLADHDEMIRAPAAEGPDQPFGDRVRAGCPDRVSSVSMPNPRARWTKSRP